MNEGISSYCPQVMCRGDEFGGIAAAITTVQNVLTGSWASSRGRSIYEALSREIIKIESQD